MIQPQYVSEGEMVFGGGAKLLPKREDIPAEFQNDSNPWRAIVSRWFFQGLPDNVEFHPKPGINSRHAYNHVAAALRSFEPEHMHKEMGCAYLLSLWFEKIENWQGTP